ncbi:protein kinase [Streptomyces roseolus]|uniref:serine/threonine-protein kinase n=1 Tax=Streptomyces roseolus TaxID=67358 RepID=UPI0037A7C142
MKIRSWPIRPDLRLTAHVVAGRYRLDDLLGRGGAADVYEAMDLRLRRPVAVKVFRPDGAAGSEERFDGEARLLARLRHPGLITVYDSGRDDRTPYLVMELVRGTTLRRRIAAAPLASDEACRMGAALASALAHVHETGVVHRDVKPANILLDEAGAPRLTDFGISRLLGTTAPTVTGTLVGTAAYMAPEQVLGRGAEPPADIYSLGLVLIESIKGELEYDGAPLEAAIARLNRPPVIPPDIPAAIAELLEAMTDADESRRPDARTCARALAVLASEALAGAAEPPAGPSALAAPAMSGQDGADERGRETLRPERADATGRVAGIEAAAPARSGPVPARTPADRPASRRAGRMLVTAGAALTVLGIGLAGSAGAPPVEAEKARPVPSRPAAGEPSSPAASPTEPIGTAAVSTSTPSPLSNSGDGRTAPSKDAAVDSGTPPAPGTPESQRGRATRPEATGPASGKGETRPGKPKPAKGRHAR